MRKTLLLTIILTTCIAATAQLKKGQWLVGGNASFNTQKLAANTSDRRYYLQLAPGAGYFIIDKLAIGMRTGFTFATYKFMDQKNTNTSFEAAPFARYYFLPAAKKVNLFADASYFTGTTTSKQENMLTNFSTKNRSSFNGYSLNAGPAIFLNKNVAIEITAGVRQTRGQSASLTSGVGFQVHL